MRAPTFGVSPAPTIPKKPFQLARRFLSQCATWLPFNLTGMREKEGRALTEESIHGRPVEGHRPLEPEVAGSNPAHELNCSLNLHALSPFSALKVICHDRSGCSP